MNPFAYKDGALMAEDVPLSRIADAVGTPVYVYSTAALTAQYQAFTGALAGMDALVAFALKANPNLAVVRTFADLGAGADTVSEGEIRRGLAAGVAPRKIVFSGVGKTKAEMAFALDSGIGQFNVESEPELFALAEIAKARGKRAPVALRVNPDVTADTHHKIATGRKHDKFGIAIDRAAPIYRRAAALPGIEVGGIAVHIGSQIASLEPFRAAFGRVSTLAHALKAEGLPLRRIDLGGGLGVTYRDETPPTPADYAALVKRLTDGLDCQLMFEPGRFLTATAGVLLARVLYLKEEAGRRFLVIDAAMNDLARPALYDAYHGILPLREAAGAALAPADVVGPVCETGDILAKDRPLPPLNPGDAIAILSAGAYGAAMASTYNSRLLVAETMVNGADYAIVRPRQTFDAALALDRVPQWFHRSSSARARGVSG